MAETSHLSGFSHKHKHVAANNGQSIFHLSSVEWSYAPGYFHETENNVASC